jgi:hypothetical protein
MVLYDAAHRVCKMQPQEVKPSNEEGTNFKQKFGSEVFCAEMNKTLPVASSDLASPFVSFLKAKFENSVNCQQACLQDSSINPICMYILAANMFTMTTNEGELLLFCDWCTCAGFYQCLSCSLLDWIRCPAHFIFCTTHLL